VIKRYLKELSNEILFGNSITTMIGRGKEIILITKLMSEKKNIIIFGQEGVGKTSIIQEVMNSVGIDRILYSPQSRTLKEALISLVLSDSGVHENINEKNILALRKALYPILDQKPDYIIFDHIDRVEPKYYSFFEYLIERELPLIIIAKGIDKKNMGHLRLVLHNFEKIEISNFDRLRSDVLVDRYVNEFNIKVTQLDNLKKGVFHFSNGNPKITRQLCSLAKDTKYQKKGFVDVKLMDLDRRIDYK